jgi:hypothetical protein
MAHRHIGQHCWPPYVIKQRSSKIFFMINKKTLPIFSLIVLSAAAIPFSFLLLWAMDVDSKTVADQFNSTLNLAIPSSIVLIVLIWFGAGLDFAISFIPKKNLRILAAILVYLFLPMICCFVLPALAIMSFSDVFQEGWEGDAGFEAGLLMTIALIPAAFGFLFIYVGAGVNALSRWLAGRIVTAKDS